MITSLFYKSKTDRFDYVAGRAFLREKQASLQAKRFALWQQASADTRQIVEMTIKKYNPERIIQWGSVLDSRHFSEASDIDLAIAGVDSISFLQLFGDAEELTRFPLDLLRWEELPPSSQRTILRMGQVIYEQS